MKRLILAGGGHAHLHVLSHLAKHRWPGVEVVLISPYERQVYSGMLPGWMAGHYALDQCVANLMPLVEASGTRYIMDYVTGLDADTKTLTTERSGALSYDILALDTGALVDSTSLASTGATLLPIRPLESFISKWSQLVERLQKSEELRFVIVGGGAAGVELALAVRYRLRVERPDLPAEVTLVSGSELLRGHGPRIVECVRKHLALEGIRLVRGYATGSAKGVSLDNQPELPADFVISATGVSPSPWLAESGLALARDGFVATGDGQRSSSHDTVFASGDVSSRLDRPHPKSGVYAVRAGPILTENLHLSLHGKAIKSYRPQKRSLYLMATGPKEAILSWNGYCISGRWLWFWKDWIDRRFMKQYHSPD